MGISLEQVFSRAPDGALVDVSLITNQDNGICSYASGALIHHAKVVDLKVDRLSVRPARLSTTDDFPLHYMFSDRLLKIAPPPGRGLGDPPQQPFSAKAEDKLGLSIARPNYRPPVALFTLHSWGNVTFSIDLEQKGNLLVGTGPAIGNQADHALYILAFTGIMDY